MQHEFRNAERSSHVKSVAKALSILQLFTARRPEWSLAELCRELRLQKTVAYNLAETLARGGLLEKDPRSRTYRVGVLAYQLGQLVSERNHFHETVRTALRTLRNTVTHTVQFGILDHGELLILVGEDGNTEIRVIAAEGERRPAYASGVGRAILSALPEDVAAELLPTHLQKLTRHTITDKAELLRVLQVAAGQGYAVQREELVDNVTAVGIPIYDSSGFPVAGISTSFLAFDDDAELIATLAHELRRTATLLSQSIGDTLTSMGDNPQIKALTNVVPSAVGGGR